MEIQPRQSKSDAFEIEADGKMTNFHEFPEKMEPEIVISHRNKQSLLRIRTPRTLENQASLIDFKFNSSSVLPFIVNNLKFPLLIENRKT